MEFRRLPGLTPYEQARLLQLELVERRARGEIGDTVLFVEHTPVITRGRGLQFSRAQADRPRHMPLPGPLPSGIEFRESERGGDLTYHGPGQLVVYPILKLDGSGFGPQHDVAAFLRRFEALFIGLIAELGQGAVEGLSREEATGVWVRRPGEPESASRKIASMGIAVRRWVTYHGLAINCVNDLAAFRLISPCGFSPEVMTRLADWLPAGSEGGQWLARWDRGGREELEARVARAWSAA